jgi:hypothetical protein
MIWKIFARQPTGMEGSEEYAAECYTSGVIAVGWNDVGDLNKFASREKLKAACVKFWSDESNRSIGQTAGVLWNFRSSVMEGDMVICPDRESGRFYIGRILSKKAFYDCSPLGGKCRFAHRRKVSWERILQSDEIRGRFGGCQTVSAVKSDPDHLFKPPRQHRRKIGHRRPPFRPDMEWGLAAEDSAMQWLKAKGYKPENVADLYVGWDITCGDEKFEVKGRKSERTAIRLTENEWKAARKLGKTYTILLFTAPTHEKLKTANPAKFPDPTRTAGWERKRRITFEYVLAD